jgi:hypothetical protein
MMESVFTAERWAVWIPFTTWQNVCVFCLCGSHFILFTTERTTLIQSNTTHAYFYSIDHSYLYTTRFGLYLGYPKAFKYENLIKEDVIKLCRTLFYIHYLYNVKT